MVSLYVVLVHRRLDRVVPDPVSTIARAGVQRSHHVVEVGLVFRAGDVDPTRVTILYGRCALGSQKEASSHRNPHGVSPVCDRFLLGRDLLCDSRDHRAELVLGVPLPVMHLLHHLLLLALDGLLQIKRSKCQGSQKVTGSRQSKVKAVGPEVKAVGGGGGGVTISSRLASALVVHSAFSSGIVGSNSTAPSSSSA